VADRWCSVYWEEVDHIEGHGIRGKLVNAFRADLGLERW